MNLITLFSFLVFFSAGGGDSPKGDLFVQIEGIEKLEGNIGLLVFNKGTGFPEQSENAILHLEVKVTSREMKINLGELPYGQYAIALIHDVNSNKALDKNVLGIPKEPFGFSNNRSILFGPPNFEEAAVLFSIQQNETKIKLIDL